MAPPTAGEQFRLMWRVAGMAMMLSAETAAGALLGWLYDRWQGTAPRGLTIGGLIGLSVGMYGFVRAAIRLNRLQRSPGAAPADRTRKQP